jgi:hypothetical protein
MDEAFIQHVWKNRLYDNYQLKLADGTGFEVLSPGMLNTDAGPDFFDVRIKINDTIWAGNAEVHINASDWEKHGHHLDASYDNVVLHVVVNNDKIIKRSNGTEVPAVSLQFSEHLFLKYHELINSRTWIPCGKSLHGADKELINCWLQKLTIERLERKTAEIDRLLKMNVNDWEETCYQHIAGVYGLRVNVEPFMRLARSLPFRLMIRQKYSLRQLEALLFGQAGMLEENNMEDSYYASLKKEYKFLQTKFNLRPVESYTWKYMRLRPANFPTIRIAQFAQLINKTDTLLNKLITMNDIDDFTAFFQTTASEYWDDHYTFNNQISKKKHKKTGSTFIHLVLINAVVPICFVYGCKMGMQDMKDKAIKLLESLPSENNSIIQRWKQTGINVKSAFESQALIQLYREYCKEKKCLHCTIGNKIITN